MLIPPFGDVTNAIDPVPRSKTPPFESSTCRYTIALALFEIIPLGVTATDAALTIHAQTDRYSFIEKPHTIVMYVFSFMLQSTYFPATCRFTICASVGK